MYSICIDEVWLLVITNMLMYFLMTCGGFFFSFQPQITIKQVESKDKPKSNKRFTPSKDEAHKIVVCVRLTSCLL